MKFWRLCLVALCTLVTFGCDSESFSTGYTQPESTIDSTTTRVVPQTYSTIQAAVDAARSGDIVRVAAGEYTENVRVRSKRISLRGAGKGSTILRGRIQIYDSPEVSIEGFTVRDGGIYAQESTIKISGNDISENTGAGLWLEHCTNAIVSDNDMHHNGLEGVLWNSTQGVLGSSRIYANGADGVVVNNASPGLTGNEVRDNGGDGIAIRGFEFAASPHLLSNLVEANGGTSHYDIICYGGNANPTGAANRFVRCLNCAECRSFDDPASYEN